MRKTLYIIVVLLGWGLHAHAVLKEKDLANTLQILRTELTDYHRALTAQNSKREEQQELIRERLKNTWQKSNQISLMLYSQKQDYVFDMTYACHEATELYQRFNSEQLPFKMFLEKTTGDISRYDSLVVSLQEMDVSTLSKASRADRAVCLKLATSIRNTLQANSSMLQEDIMYYEMTEKRLSHLNDYANKRYNEIQKNIFVNGGDNYLAILKDFRRQWSLMERAVDEKYRPQKNLDSQWDSRWILGLFVIMVFYALLASVLNQIAIRYLLPKRFRTENFMKKRACVIMATTTITFALILGIIRNTWDQNFIIMASDLLVEYAWLLGVILFSLLLRVDGDQIKSAFRTYSPLLVMGFIVIAFRIILVPNELVNIIFPPILLVCAFWQGNVIKRHGKRIPRSDVFYSYFSLMVFIASVCCSWAGYTLLSVQMLIWWIMQLTCILTITCISQYMKLYGDNHGYQDKPITQTWLYRLAYQVVLPIMGVFSVMISIYWAADVFNLSDLCWRIFNYRFIDFPNLQVSIIKIATVINLWFIFSYITQTVLELMRLHYQQRDPSTAASREMMGKNVVQVLVWGVWLLMSLSILHVSVAWLLAISGGLSTGIGFASKDIIENIYYGASLMAGRIKVGDWIEVDGTMGKVTSISYTSTLVESLYGEVIAFQNSQLFTKNYKNLTRNHGYILALVPFGVSYGSNVQSVTKMIEEAVTGLHHQWIDKSKKVKVVFTEFGDSSVNMKLIVWVDAVKKIYVLSDIMRCIYNTLNKNGVEIPFPQQDVYIKEIQRGEAVKD